MIIAACESGGRFDHIMGQINTLYEAAKITSIPVLLVSEYCITFLLCEVS